MSRWARIARTLLHRTLFLLALPLAFPVTLALVECALVGASGWSWALSLGLSLVVAGLLSLSLRPSRRPPLGRLGLAVLAVTVLARAAVRAPEGPVSLSSRPQDTPLRAPSWLLEERDMVLVGADLLARSGALMPGEAVGLVGALEQAYQELEGWAGAYPSPLLASLTGSRRVMALDTLVVRPDVPAPENGVIFLHGHGGSFAWPCLYLARAALAVDALTACPTVGSEGRWWSPEGEETVLRTLDWVEGQGVERVVLAGLSNGAVGAVALAPRLAPRLRGLVLISGARSGAGTAGLPTLLIQGSNDGRVSTAAMRRFARQQGRALTYMELEGDHFVYLRRRQEMGERIALWLRDTLSP